MRIGTRSANASRKVKLRAAKGTARPVQRRLQPRRMKRILLMHLALARALRAPIRPRAVSRLSSWGGDFDEVSTGDGARKPKRPDTRPDFAKPNYREPRSPGRGGGRGRGRGGGRGRGRGEQRGRNEQTYVRRERQQRHWDAFMEDDGNEFVYGIAPVLAALKADRRSKYALYVLEESRRKESRLDAVEALARENDVEIIQVEKGLLNEAVNDRPHQGCILCASKLEFASLDAWEHASEGAGWLALDEIVDPQNLGSLCRTARFLGASVLVSAKNSAPLSAAASKASAGAIEEAPVYAVPNLPRALEDAKAQGWRVLGAGVGDNSVPVSDLDPAQPSVLVVGSEGEGLRTTVRRACDALVQVGEAPMDSGVDSLNVGVAGAILLHHLLGGPPPK